MISPYDLCAVPDVDFVVANRSQRLQAMLEVEKSCRFSPTELGMESWSLDSMTKIIGLVHHEILIGYVAVKERNGWIQLLRIALIPDYRDRGLGSQIVGALQLMNPGIEVKALVEEQHVRAQQFLVKRGFQYVSTHQDVLPDQDCYLFSNKV